MLSTRLSRSVASVAAAVAIAGGAYGIVSATAGNSSGTQATAASQPAPAGHGFGGRGGSNARSGPAAGGAAGTVAAVSTASFTITTPAGQKVTVNKASSTKYTKGTSTTRASAVRKGVSVLVLGTVNSTTIQATQVAVQATGGSATSSAAGVVPFQRGAPSTAKQVGQIPANYSQGSGTIVSGASANSATKAALATYPGGIVDRVVQLSNGEYEVHNIGVNWPHHIFVDQSFEVVGAN